ncbi:MAG: DUF490 domain-containing protein [Rhodobacteraceae bacterium]|nr:DUF490 domain-containing protein [Paracoccaceae bacterium]
MRRWFLIAALAAPLPVLAQDIQAQERGFFEGLIEDSLSGEGRVVDVQGFEGALSSTATIQQLTVADAGGIWLTLQDVTLNWNRAALLSGALQVTELSAKRVLVPRAPQTQDALPDAEATPIALPDLPVSIEIAKLAIDRAELGKDLIGQEAILSLAGSGSLIEGAGQVDLSITRLAPQSGSLTLIASYGAQTQDLTVDLSLSEPRNGLLATSLGLPGTPSVDLQLKGTGSLSDFAGDLALRTDAQPRLTGQFTLGQPAEDTQFRAQMQGDVSPLFAPEYRAFFGPDLRVQASGARTANGQLRIEAFHILAQSLTARGSLGVSETGQVTQANLTARIVPTDGTPVALPLPGARTTLSGAQLHLQFDSASGDGWSLDGQLDRLHRPDLSIAAASLLARGTARPAAIGGQVALTAQGVLPQDADLARALGDALRADFRFDWAPDPGLKLRDLSVSGSPFELSGQADIAHLDGAAELRIDTQAALSVPDLTHFAGLAGQPVSGRADMRLSGEILPISGGFNLHVQGNTQNLSLGPRVLDAALNGPGTLEFTAKRNNDGTVLEGLSAQTAAARISGAAQISSTTAQAVLRAESADVSALWPALSGAATLAAQLERKDRDWTLTATAQAPGEATAKLEATATGAQWDTLEAQAVLQAEIAALSAYADLSGQPIAGRAQLSLQGTGKPAEQSFDVDMSLDAKGLKTGLAQLDSLLRDQATARVQIGRDRQRRITLHAADFQSPELTAKAESAADQALSITARLRDLAVLESALSGPASLTGTLRQINENWALQATGAGPGGTRMNASGQVARDGSAVDLALDGVAPLALANDILRPRSLSGLLQYDLKISGPPELASVSGQISTQGARMSLPSAGLALEDIAASIQMGANQAQLALSGGVSTGGRLRVTGPVSLSPPYAADLEAELTSVRLTDPTLFETAVDGRVRLSGPLTGGADLSGRLALSDSELRIPANSGASHATLPGLQHVNEPAPVRNTRQNAGMLQSADGNTAAGPSYDLDLRILAPDRIFVRGRGLDAELGGVLQLSGTTQNVVPQGRFDLIRGRLDILGKRLTLDEGLIQLQGAFDPFIRFVASTETSDATASIQIQGQASAPELSFASSPDLPQDEVLALILFGKGISSISALQAVRLAAAVRTLTGGGTGLGGKVRKGLALDDLDITTSEEGATEARIGKYLGENIYSEVTADSEGNSQINLNLNINRSVTARGRLSSDGETGIGIFIEKDY